MTTYTTNLNLAKPAEGDTDWADEVNDNWDILDTAMVPIGAIIAWHKDFANTPALPGRFVECNGQTLSDADSPYNGQTIPDLNGNARFLRGSGTSGTNQAEATKAPSTAFTTGNQSASHTHTTNIGAITSGGRSVDHTHDTEGTNQMTTAGVRDGGSFDAYVVDTGTPTTGNSSADHTHSHTHGNKTSGNQSADHTHSITGGGDAETRPINMSVVWIMRVK